MLWGVPIDRACAAIAKLATQVSEWHLKEGFYKTNLDCDPGENF